MKTKKQFSGLSDANKPIVNRQVRPEVKGYLPNDLSIVLLVLNEILMRHLREVGVNIVQFRGLQVIADFPQSSVGDLARIIVADQPVVSRVVDQLVSRELVMKKKRRDNARSVELSLTPKGQGLIDYLQPIATTIQLDALSVLSPEERSNLTDYLKRIFDHAAPPSYTGVVDRDNN